MIQVSLSELKANAGRYVSMVDSQDVFITRNGKTVARLTTAKVDKVTAAQALFGILSNDEANLEKDREERLK